MKIINKKLHIKNSINNNKNLGVTKKFTDQIEIHLKKNELY